MEDLQHYAKKEEDLQQFLFSISTTQTHTNQYKQQRKCGIQRLTQVHVNKWTTRSGTEPETFQLEDRLLCFQSQRCPEVTPTKPDVAADVKAVCSVKGTTVRVFS